MVRLKFCLFAVAVLGVWLAHLKLIAPLTERAVEMARARGLAAPAALEYRVLQRRSDLQRMLLKAVSTPAANSTAQANRAAGGDRLAAVRADLKDVVPDDLKAELIVGVAGDSVGSFSAEDSDRAQGLDLSAIADQAGSNGLIQDLAGVQHVFYSVAVGPARIVIGAPLIPNKVAEAIASELDLAAVAIVQKGRVVATGGPEKGSVELLAKNTRSGKPEYIKRGEAGSFGPVRLPMFVGGGESGAPLFLANRRPTKVPSTEIVSVVSLKPYLTTLSDYQNLALWIFGGLLTLSIVIGLIIRPAGQPKDQEEQPEELEASEHVPTSPIPALGTEPGEEGFASAELLPPEANPDSHLSPAPFPFEAPSAERATLSIPPAGVPAPASVEPEEPTRAYPALSEQSGPEPMLLGGEGSATTTPDPDSNPEATRLAPVPEELIRASASPVEPPARLKADNGVSEEEDQHFREVYRDFLTTRKKCGELADGLSYEKFAHKLRKNRDQLVEKYSCRTVRFHVYVKEGKAALKATPIRD